MRRNRGELAMTRLKLSTVSGETPPTYSAKGSCARVKIRNDGWRLDVIELAIVSGAPPSWPAYIRTYELRMTISSNAYRSDRHGRFESNATNSEPGGDTAYKYRTASYSSSVK